MDEIWSFASKLSNVGFPTLLFLIGAASYYKKWYWGWQYDAMITDYEKRLAKAETDSSNWQNMALSAAGLAETSVNIAKRSA